MWEQKTYRLPLFYKRKRNLYTALLMSASDIFKSSLIRPLEVVSMLLAFQKKKRKWKKNPHPCSFFCGSDLAHCGNIACDFHISVLFKGKGGPWVLFLSLSPYTQTHTQITHTYATHMSVYIHIQRRERRNDVEIFFHGKTILFASRIPRKKIRGWLANNFIDWLIDSPTDWLIYWLIRVFGIGRYM